MCWSAILGWLMVLACSFIFSDLCVFPWGFTNSVPQTVFETYVHVPVMLQLAKWMVCSCSPIYRDDIFCSFFSVGEKTAVCICVVVWRKSETQGDFFDLLGSSQHNTCVVLSKIYAVLKVNIYKKHQNQVPWFVHEKALQSFKAVVISHGVQMHFMQNCHKIIV